MWHPHPEVHTGMAGQDEVHEDPKNGAPRSDLRKRNAREEVCVSVYNTTSSGTHPRMENCKELGRSTLSHYLHTIPSSHFPHLPLFLPSALLYLFICHMHSLPHSIPPPLTFDQILANAQTVPHSSEEASRNRAKCLAKLLGLITITIMGSWVDDE